MVTTAPSPAPAWVWDWQTPFLESSKAPLLSEIGALVTDHMCITSDLLPRTLKQVKIKKYSIILFYVQLFCS